MDADSKAQEILFSIFYGNDKTSTISPIIKNQNEISSLLQYLLDPNSPINGKTFIISHLSKSFEAIPFNADVFLKATIENQMNLLKIAIYLYLHEESLQDTLKPLITHIITNVTCDINIFRYTHDFIKQYMLLENDTYDISEIKNKTKSKLTQKQFSSYLHLLQLLFCQSSVSPRKPNNYIYFLNSGMLLIHNNDSLGPKALKVTNDETLNFVLWIRLELSPEERKEYFTGQNFNLLRLDVPDNNFSVQINENNEIITNTKANPFQLNHKQWYCILFQVIKGDKQNQLNINIYVNLQSVIETIVNDVKLEQINSVIFLQGFIGECTSIVFFHTNKKQSPVFFLKDNSLPFFEFGIYSEEIIAPLMYNYTSQMYNQLILTDEQKILMKQSSQLSRNLISCFLPTRFESFGSEDIFMLFDFKSGLKAQLKNERGNDNGIKGIHLYTASHENIDNVGGVVSLLPIIELLTNLDKYNESIEKDVLCKKTVEEFIGLFWGLMSAKRNLIDAQNNNFFYCLSLFMEKISKEHFETAIDGFMQISFSCVNSGITHLVEEFYRYIFFNTTLLLKVDYKVLNKVWEHLKIHSYNFLFCFNLANWCDLIIKYDAEHNEKFCCEKHSLVFINKNNKTNANSANIMDPPLLARMLLFYETILKGLNEEHKKNNKIFITLVKLLSFEFSPCMQHFVIKLINACVTKNQKLLIEHKNLLQDSFKNIIKNAVTDIKIEIFNLMIWADKAENSSTFIKDNVDFILQNFKPLKLPENTGLVCDMEIFNKTLEDHVADWLKYLGSQKNSYFILLILLNLIKHSNLSYIAALFLKLNTNIPNTIPLSDHFILQSRKFKDKFIDVVFEIYLLANNSKLNPKFKPSFTINYTNYDEITHKIQEIGIQYLVTAANKKLKLLEELLSWGKLQQILFGTNETYQQMIVSFLKTIFEQVINMKFKQRKHYIFSDKEKLELVTIFVWYYELATFFNFKLNETEYKYNLFDLKIGENKQLQGKFYDILLSLCENISLLVWDKDFKGVDVQRTFPLYIENPEKNKKINYYYKEIKFILTDIGNEAPNQPEQMPINAISAFYMLVLQSLPNNDEVFKDWLNKIFVFLHFLIIASTTLKRNKDEKLYDKLQQKVFDIILLSINTFLGEIEKRESNPSIIKLLKDYLKKLLGFCDRIYQLYKNEEKEKLDKKKLKIENFLSMVKNVIKPNEDRTTNAIYLLFEKKGLSAYLSENAYKNRLDEKIERMRVFNHEAILNLRKTMNQGISVLFDLNKKIDINKFDTKKDVLNKLFHQKDNASDSLFNISQLHSSLLEEINNAEIERKIQFYEKNQIYKRIKKNLFTFRNVWSYQKIFMENKHLIKHRRINHLTKDFTRLMFTPIIDIYTYIPEFSSFKVENMFYTENKDKPPYVPYLADLSPADYSLVEEKDHLKIMENAKKNNPSFTMNIYYKHLSNIYTKKEIQGDKTKKSMNINLVKVKAYLTKKYNISLHNSKLEECCFVKESYHIKGFFIVTPNEIHFYACSFDNSNIIEEYDEERKTCYGAVFNHPKDCDKHCHIVINCKEIDMFLKRRYNFRMKAIEIFTKKKKQYYFKFHSPSICESIMAAIKKTLDNSLKQLDLLCKTYNNYIGYANISDNVDPKLSIKEKYEQWKEWKISTFEFLMYVNIYGNRSFIDLVQYPVAPWPIFDYSSPSIEITEESKHIVRDFSQAMGMQVYDKVPESEERKNNFLYHYENMIVDGEEDPHHFGSHYSSPLYVAHYNDRIFPMAFLHIELQGSTFDDPNRLFICVEKTSENTLFLKTDVRELTPEFFCTPEIFINYNEFNFGNYLEESTNKEFRVDHVELPNWSRDVKGNDAYTFVYKFRKILECKEISYLIHEWFDIIFGTKIQSIEANNRFIKESSEKYEKIFNALSNTDKSYAIRISEFGLCPAQVFNSLVAGRKKIELNRIKTLNEIPLTTEYLQEAKKIPLSFKISKIGNKDVLLQLFNDQLITYIICNKENQFHFPNHTQEKEVMNDFILERDKATSFRDISIINNFVHEEIPPLEIFNNSKTVVIGGFWSGELLLLDLNEEHQKRKEVIYQNYEKTPFTSISINSFDSFIACGTKMGFVYIYKVNKSKKTKDILLEEYAVLKHQKSEIVDVIINDNLNLLLTLSQSGYAAVYTFPSCKLINHFYVDSNVCKCLISSAPLPCFLFLVKERTVFKCYSINGKLLIEETMEGTVQHFKLFTGFEFTEHLICIVKDISGNNLVEIRDLPYLQNDSTLIKPIINSEILIMDVSKDGSFAIVLEKSKVGKKDELTIIKKEKIKQTTNI